MSPHTLSHACSRVFTEEGSSICSERLQLCCGVFVPLLFSQNFSPFADSCRNPTRLFFLFCFFFYNKTIILYRKLDKIQFGAD